MIRTAVVELFLPGGGYAATGHLRWAAAAVATLVAALALALVTPWAILALVALRLGAVVDASRRARRGPAGGHWRWGAMLLVGAVGLGSTLAARATALEVFTIPTSSMSPTLQLDDKISVDTLSPRWRGPGRGEVVTFRMGARTYVKRVIATGGDTVAVRGGQVVVNGEALPRRHLGPGHYLDRDERGRDVAQDAVAFEERAGGRRYTIFGGVDDEGGGGHGDGPGSGRGSGGGDGGGGGGSGITGDALAGRPARGPALGDYPRLDLGGLGCAPDLPAQPDTVPLTPTGDGACRVPPGAVFVLGDNRGNSRDSRHVGAIPVAQVQGRVIGIWLGGAGRRWSRIGAVE